MRKKPSKYEQLNMDLSEPIYSIPINIKEIEDKNLAHYLQKDPFFYFKLREDNALVIFQGKSYINRPYKVGSVFKLSGGLKLRGLPGYQWENRRTSNGRIIGLIRYKALSNDIYDVHKMFTPIFSELDVRLLRRARELAISKLDAQKKESAQIKSEHFPK